MAGPEPQTQTQSDAAAHLGELSRRLGNSYAMLRSIIRRSAESATSVESFAWHLEGRLDVIGRIMLAAMRGPDVSFDLCRLIEAELSEVEERLAQGVQQAAVLPVFSSVDPGQAFLDAPIDIQRAVLRAVLRVEVLPATAPRRVWKDDRLRLSPVVPS